MLLNQLYKSILHGKKWCKSSVIMSHSFSIMIAYGRLKSWCVAPDEIDPVPPNATVVFEVEVYSVSRGPRSMEAFKDMDLDKDRSLTKAEVTII